MGLENSNLDRRDIKPNLEEVRKSYADFLDKAKRVTALLIDSDQDANKAAQVLGIKAGIETHDEDRKNKILTAEDLDVLLSAMNSVGGMTGFAKFYSIAKTVYAEDERFKGLIEALEGLVNSINNSSVTDAKMELPPALFTEYNEEEFAGRFERDQVPDTDFVNLTSVGAAFKKAYPNMEVGKVYSGVASGFGYKLSTKKFKYRPMVAKVNPMTYLGAYEANKINF